MDLFSHFFEKYGDIALEAPDATQYARNQMQSLSNRTGNGNLNGDPDETRNQPNRAGDSSPSGALGNIPSYDNPSQSVKNAQSENDEMLTDEPGGGEPENSPDSSPDDEMNMDDGTGDEMNMEETEPGMDEAQPPEEQQDPFESKCKEQIRINCISLYDTLCANIKTFNSLHPMKNVTIDESYYIIQKDLEQLKNLIYNFITDEFLTANFGTAKRKYKTFIEIYKVLVNMTREYIKERKKAEN